MPLIQKAFHGISQDGQKQRQRLRWYSKGEMIPLIAPGIWQVCQGIVQLSKINFDGEEVLLGWALPDTSFRIGLAALDTYQAQALSEVHLKWFSMIELEACPHLSHSLLNQLGHRIQQTEALLAIAGLRRVEDRLQQLLFLLKQEMGEPVPEGTRLSVRMTHQNLANAIGTSRVTVTKTLGELHNRGMITFDRYRHIIVKHGIICNNL
ncbi:Crp/Fnr family transcriptional regulator [Moorena sp. SIO2C4]|uniref:Crp/Fnr family transcriptional regulator n=1 Tax=Moorena sp. SIO2C4 TaxID=2607824 RepID=UPI0013CB3861|nr:Crp/Fnr family transcriptional regulator [Moorena sp. SIO2C4]NES45403.1 Crp/Fnr family transcriptional regulator [Moorena sp. SIO2C4]